MDTIEVNLEVELSEDKIIEVTATFEYEGGLDGIGEYEYAGQKCFDKGEWRVEGVWFKEFSCDAHEELSAEEKLKVEIFCETYAESGNVKEKIYQLEQN